MKDDLVKLTTKPRTIITEEDAYPQPVIKKVALGLRKNIAIIIIFIAMLVALFSGCESLKNFTAIGIFLMAIIFVGIGIIAIYHFCCKWASSKNKLLFWLFWGTVISLGVFILATFPWV